MRRLIGRVLGTDEGATIFARAEELVRVLAGDQMPPGTLRWLWMP